LEGLEFLEGLELLLGVGIESHGLFRRRRCEDEFKTPAIVGHGGKTVIWGEHECTTDWFVRHGIDDDATHAISEICVSGVLGCQSRENASENRHG